MYGTSICRERMLKIVHPSPTGVFLDELKAFGCVRIKCLYEQSSFLLLCCTALLHASPFPILCLYSTWHFCGLCHFYQNSKDSLVIASASDKSAEILQFGQSVLTNRFLWESHETVLHSFYEQLCQLQNYVMIVLLLQAFLFLLVTGVVRQLISS